MDVLLTDREADIMRVLWEHGPSVVAEVRAKLSDRLAYTTVLTILRVLETKGYVGHEQQGRVHQYFATVRRTAARKSALRHLAGKLFEGSAELLLTHLVSDRRLTAEQIERMQKILQDKTDRDNDS